MNTLTHAGVFVEDKLFATLDPTTRALRLPNGDKVMLVDTVGFINKIPHSLIDAFKSTLEEVRRADLLLHLVDLTHPLFEEQIQIVESVLKEIGAGDLPALLVPNKMDAAPSVAVPQLKQRTALDVCPISALTGAGIDSLLEAVGAILDRGKERLELCLTAEQAPLVSLLRQSGRILNESYDGDRIRVSARVTPKLAGQIRQLVTSPNGRGAKRREG
jgi:GTP-binding protein HflX